MSKVRILFLLSFFIALPLKANDSKEKSLVEFVTSILTKKPTCNNQQVFKDFGAGGDIGFATPKFMICKLPCGLPQLGKENIITESDRFEFQIRLVERMINSCKKINKNFRYNKNGLNCKTYPAAGGIKEEPIVPLYDDDKIGYRCEVICKEDGIVEYEFNGLPSEHAWLKWQAIKSCRHEKTVIKRVCQFY